MCETGTGAAGLATPQWLAMVAKKNPGRLAAARDPKPETAEERAWAELIASRCGAWGSMVQELAAPYVPARPPTEVRVVVGNRGAEDAFTHGPTVIGFDASALHANYGDADAPDNRARIDRFFRHEYTHVMQKAWFATHQAPLDTPLQRAAVELWTEGLGNRESLSAKWVENGALTDHARKTLDRLMPIMREHLSALKDATPERATELTKDLSNGPFDQKWGALPVALWLAEDEARAPGAIRRFVERGPQGALEYVDARLRARD